MTDDTVTPVDISDNLDEFEADFYSKTPAKDDTVVTNQIEEEEAPEDDPLAPSEDEAEADEPEAETESDEDEDEEPEDKPKPRNKTQERIEKLVAKTREQERREAELIRRIEQLEASGEKAPKPVREMLPVEAPNPDAKGDDGEPVYPLGEFDPAFIRDITKFTVEQEVKAVREAEAQAQHQKAFAAAQQELANNWMEKLDAYEEVEPEIRENIRDLTDTFQSIDQGYGEYLASTIMLMDEGPAIMNYLANNIGEAQKIVASGPAAATLALGRLDAMLAGPKQESKRNIQKVSSAQEPPVTRTRGSGGKFTTPPDTDDLDAFEKIFYAK